MRLEEFVKLVQGEHEKTVTPLVRSPSADAFAAARRPGGIPLTDFLAMTEGEAEPRATIYRHTLGAPASNQAISARERALGVDRLPPDLRELLAEVNGIHLWATIDTGRAYAGIAPVEEWERARVKMYGADAPEDLLDDRYIALSYQQDGAAYVVFDPQSGTYYLMDTAGPDTSTPIAANVSELLDWVWEARIAPDRTDPGGIER